MDMSELLNGAGFHVNENTSAVKPYKKLSECKLPFGSCTSESDEDQYYDIYKKSLKGINYFRTNAMPFDLSKFEVLEKNEIYDWLNDNQSKCKIIPTNSISFYKDNGYIEDTDSYCDCDFGDRYSSICDIIFYINYNSQFEKFEFTPNPISFNLNIPEQHALKRLYWDEVGSYYSQWRGNEFDWFRDNCFSKAEFIPVVIDTYSGLTISHKAYKDKSGYVDEVTSPCLGKNIKKSKHFMDGLKEWVDEGGIIKDNNLYLILENRNPDKPGKYYLKRYN